MDSSLVFVDPHAPLVQQLSEQPLVVPQQPLVAPPAAGTPSFASAGQPASGSRKRVRGSNWDAASTLALVAAVKAQAVSNKQWLGKEAKWQDVTVTLQSQGIMKDWKQLENKWGNLTQTFKKVKDWQANAGQQSYWGLTDDEKKEADLPVNMDKDVYTAVEEFAVARPASFPAGSSHLKAEHSPSPSTYADPGVTPQAYVLNGAAPAGQAPGFSSGGGSGETPPAQGAAAAEPAEGAGNAPPRSLSGASAISPARLVEAVIDRQIQVMERLERQQLEMMAKLQRQQAEAQRQLMDHQVKQQDRLLAALDRFTAVMERFRGMESNDFGQTGLQLALLAQPESSDRRKRNRGSNWDNNATLQLVLAVRQQHQSQQVFDRKEPRWSAISEALRANGVHRDWKQLENKWGNLMYAYKKVKDWHDQRSTSTLYWSLTDAEKKASDLPANMPREVFDAMTEAMPFISGTTKDSNTLLHAGIPEVS